MEKKDNLSVVFGWIFILAGLIGIVISFLFVWPLIFYSVGASVIGIVILLTLKQQDYIEPIKTNKKGEN